MKVSVSKGATINLGNYESARVDITVEDDTLGASEIEEMVDSWLRKEVEKIEVGAGIPPRGAKRFGA
jgi:hypothetical protein